MGHAGLGFVPAARKFVEVFGITWAGSQITKVRDTNSIMHFVPYVYSAASLLIVTGILDYN